MVGRNLLTKSSAPTMAAVAADRVRDAANCAMSLIDCGALVLDLCMENGSPGQIRCRRKCYVDCAGAAAARIAPFLGALALLLGGARARGDSQLGLLRWLHTTFQTARSTAGMTYLRATLVASCGPAQSLHRAPMPPAQQRRPRPLRAKCAPAGRRRRPRRRLAVARWWLSRRS